MSEEKAKLRIKATLTDFTEVSDPTGRTLTFVFRPQQIYASSIVKARHSNTHIDIWQLEIKPKLIRNVITLGDINITRL